MEVDDFVLLFTYSYFEEVVEMASQYLAAKTSELGSTKPVDPAQAQVVSSLFIIHNLSTTKKHDLNPFVLSCFVLVTCLIRD